MGRIRRWLRKPVVIVALVLAVGAGGFGMYWFQPWKLWVDETVNEALPTVTGEPEQPDQPEDADEPDQPEVTPEPDEPEEPAGPETLATGSFISHEHSTDGTVQLLRLEDGSLVLRLEDLDTSNGPDLQVWVTDAPVVEGQDGWHVFDDGAYLNAGKLKGNKGSQNYPLPSDFDLDAFSSVSVWCARFSVSFGAAELTWA
jgi:hypothetical protein